MLNLVGTYRSSFSPLRLRNFRIYLGGQAISLIGTWLQAAAQQWVVWELSHSEASLGLVTALGTLPILLLGLWAGVWADRWDRRRLLIGTQTAAMILAFSLAVLVLTGAVQLWHVYVLSFLLGVVTALDFPAQQAFLGDLSGMSEVRKAVNLNAMIVQVSRMIGPALAGFVIGGLGAGVAFGLNGLSFLAVIASLLLVRSQQIKAPPSGKSMVHEFVEGLKFIKGQPRMQDLLIFVVLVTFLGFPVLTIAPAFADTILHGNAETYGLLLSASGAGALIGVLFVVPLAQAARRTGLILIGATAWMGLWFAVIAGTATLAVAEIGIFLFSIGAPTILTMALGLIQLLSPQNMRARLVTVFIMVSFGMQPIASLLIGLSAEAFSIPIAILINAVLLTAGAAAMFLFRPALRGWEANRHAPGAHPAAGQVPIETIQDIISTLEQP